MEVSLGFTTSSYPGLHLDVGRTVFRLPVELIVEIFTYFGDPRRTIINAKTVRGAGIALDPKHVEWSTIIRRLTMTCWYLRNMLLPLLWEHVEGCKVLYRRPLPEDPGPKRMVLAGSGLYAQCAYLVLNPTIAAYVRCARPHTRRLRLTWHHFAGPSLWTYGLGATQEM